MDAHIFLKIVCVEKRGLINFGLGSISIGGVDMENTAIMKGIALFATLTGIYQWLGQGTSFMDIMVLLFATALVISMDGGGQKHQEVQPVSDVKETGDNQNTKKRGVFFCWLISNTAEAFASFQRNLFAHFFAKTSNKLILEPFYYYS
jgi:hypothetical protein